LCSPGLPVGRCCESLLDEGRLAAGVGVAIQTELGDEGPLQFRVGAGLVWVGAEVVAEGEVASQFAAVCRADVEVVVGPGMPEPDLTPFSTAYGYRVIDRWKTRSDR
jgi:hypothetical protein